MTAQTAGNRLAARVKSFPSYQCLGRGPGWSEFLGCLLTHSTLRETAPHFSIICYEN